MVRIKGTDQMGNARYKRGTKSTLIVKKNWRTSFDGTVTLAQANQNLKLEDIIPLGAETVFVCDELDVDWGLGDDPIDEDTRIFIVIAPFQNFDVNHHLGDITEISYGAGLQVWRTIGTDAGPTMVTAKVLSLQEPIRYAADDSHFLDTTNSPTSLMLAGFSSTTTKFRWAGHASGNLEFHLPERSQPMREWAGYDYEEIFDVEVNDDE